MVRPCSATPNAWRRWLTEQGLARWCPWRHAEAAAWLPVAPLGTFGPLMVPVWRPRGTLTTPRAAARRMDKRFLGGVPRVPFPVAGNRMGKGFYGNQDALKGAIRSGIAFGDCP